LLGDFLAEQFQKPAAIVIINKDVGPRVAAGSQLIQRAGIFQTQGTGPAGNLDRNQCKVRN
jgi:hypothetical protein